MFERILIICTGNICRSPMAEALLQRRLNLAGHDATLQSAGTAALRLHPADEPAQLLMGARGLDITAHRARQVSHELTRWAELILVMENHHRDSILEMDATARGKTYLLGHWTGQEIPDPYQRGEAIYAQALNLIDEALETWIRKIEPPSARDRVTTTNPISP
jgi:protein-tyrosine phosphatase